MRPMGWGPNSIDLVALQGEGSRLCLCTPLEEAEAKEAV